MKKESPDIKANPLAPQDQTALSSLLRDLEEDKAIALARQMLAAGASPQKIMRECQEGMLEVGRLYEKGHYYVSGLIMAGEILREITDLLKLAITDEPSVKDSLGVVLLGTVKGDIHDIGKNMVGMLLECNGFTVHDLGVDVPPEVFLETAMKISPDIIGMSGLLTVSYDSMRDTIKAIQSCDVPAISRTPIVVGGSLLNDSVAKYVGANYWAKDAIHGLQIFQKLAGGGMGKQG